MSRALTAFCKLKICCRKQRCHNIVLFLSRNLSNSGVQRDKFFITTPIFYVNAAPHIGHLYTAVLADALARWNRLKGSEVLFTTGTDEHGLKIQQAAKTHNLPPLEYCDGISKQFKDLFDTAGISYNDFIRTTEQRHKTTVENFWNKLKNNGFIYKGSYEGWYSISDEEFLSIDDVTDGSDKNGKPCKISKLSGHPVTWTEEENYIFKLSEFKADLQKWLDQNVIQPGMFEPQVREWLKKLPDLSVSRTSDRLTWGIPVPENNSQTIYVWLDALVNYYTSAMTNDADFWPADVHVVGKDILRFHAIFWPAFLMAAELPLPQRILCHSHWMVDDHKMSKSLGNVVDPVEKMEKYTVDGFRYFLLHEGTLHSDANYTESRILDLVNADLVNTLGNLLSRCAGKAINRKQAVPVMDSEVFEKIFPEEDVQKFQSLFTLADEIEPHYQDGNIYKTFPLIIFHLSWANKVFQDHEPWVLVKDESKTEHLMCILHISFETLRVCGILLQPVIPHITNHLLNKLAVPVEKRRISDSRSHLNDMERTLGSESGVLIKRIKKS